MWKTWLPCYLPLSFDFQLPNLEYCSLHFFFLLCHDAVLLCWWKLVENLLSNLPEKQRNITACKSHIFLQSKVETFELQALCTLGCYFCLTHPGLELCCCNCADEDILFSFKKSTHFDEAIPCRAHFGLKCNIAIMQKCWELSTSCTACSWSTGKHRIRAILNAFWFLSREALLGSLTLHTSWHGGGEMPP